MGDVRVNGVASKDHEVRSEFRVRHLYDRSSRSTGNRNGSRGHYGLSLLSGICWNLGCRWRALGGGCLRWGNVIGDDIQAFNAFGEGGIIGEVRELLALSI